MDEKIQSSSVQHIKKMRWKTAIWVVVVWVVVLVMFKGEYDRFNRFLETRQMVNQNKVENEMHSPQEDVSFEKMLHNIGPIAGAKDGLVIASPSHGEVNQPDYLFTWTRDSALTIKTLLNHFLDPHYLVSWTYDTALKPRSESRDLSHTKALLEPLIREYISSQAGLQVAQTLSGGLEDGGLNEPKFYPNGTVFSGSWGRPQRDGPALRALALIPYTHYLLDRGHAMDSEYVLNNLYNPHSIRKSGSVVKNDLEEIAHGWWKQGFDLWEEVNGHHLWTRLVSLRALQAGTILAGRMGDPHAAAYYAAEAEKIEARLANFWVYGQNHTGYWTSSISGWNQLEARDLEAEVEEENENVVAVQHRSDKNRHTDQQVLGSQLHVPEMSADVEDKDDFGQVLKSLDCGFLLSIIHTSTPPKWNTTESSWTSFDPAHPGVLATLREYAISMEGEYPVNSGKRWVDGILVGRYKGDEYDGLGKSVANPWFICTHSFAHVLYQTHSSLLHSNKISLSPHSKPFWSDLLNAPTENLGVERDWTQGSDRFESALKAIWHLAERYRLVSKTYIGVKGEMSEQIDRLMLDTVDPSVKGTLRGAKDLTWSHASYLDMNRARRQAIHDWKESGRSYPIATR